MIAAKRTEMAPRLLTEKEAMSYVRLGRTSFRKLAEIIGARKKIGRSVRYDKGVIDKYLDEAGGQDQDDVETDS